tara:strand:- start:3957 stop:4493 length:537 start_codon:yes stop_codon:yes gene_type:complete
MAVAKSKAPKSKKRIDYKSELKKNKLKLDQANRKIKKTISEFESVKDKHVRLLSEFDNFRKRTISEKEKLINYDGEKMITLFLPIFDDLGRTVSEDYKDSKSIQEGLEIIILSINKILNDNDIKEFSSLNQKFNPDLHEALMTEPGKEDNIVVKEFQKGYKYKDKVIRHAKVVVSAKS